MALPTGALQIVITYRRGTSSRATCAHEMLSEKAPGVSFGPKLLGLV